MHFWAECVLTAVHLINRLPTALLSQQTPFERLYGQVPSYSHLKVFGCLAYATIVHVSHKFAPRAKRVFLGYLVSQKAYKLYDLTTHKIFTSRDIVFHEHLFPFESPPSIPTPIVLVIPSFISDPPLSDTFPTISTTPLESVHSVTSLDLTLQDSPSASLPPSTSTFVPPVLASLVQPPSSITPVQPLRRSQRHHSPPCALRDYVSNHVTSPKPSSPSSSGSTTGTRYPLCNFISYHRYSPQHHSFVATIS